MTLTITVDVGGTFSDVTVVEPGGGLRFGKAPTTHDRAFDGINAALADVGRQMSRSVDDLLVDASLFVYSTTRATNAVLERRCARTAILVTEGFPDILVLREGGKAGIFDLDVDYPEPAVPRRLTFEVPERIDADGRIVRALDEPAVRAIAQRIRNSEVEAVAVCLLWSIANPEHERRVGQILAEELDGIPFTLSHELSPVIREYRRASTTVIDASLKPLMARHLTEVERDLRSAGFSGTMLCATSFGGVMHTEDLAEKPVYSVRSGPALAPVAASAYAQLDTGVKDIVVCDMGGTSFDVSIIRDGTIEFTRETWLGERFAGNFIAKSSVDVRSTGAGGGSIASVDDGGMLRVGPASAGSTPGPACYGRGGLGATVTDAALILGYLRPDAFLGGRLTLDRTAADRAIATVAKPLGLSVEECAAAIFTVATEHMVTAVAEITINQGLDPREVLLVAGGGAVGMVISQIAAELGCRQVLIPRTASALSAVGGQFSDVITEFNATHPTATDGFDFAGVADVLSSLADEAEDFAETLRQRGIDQTRKEYFADARYRHQMWDLELPLEKQTIEDERDLECIRQSFDDMHKRLFSVAATGHPVELLTWKVRVIAPLGHRVQLGDERPAPVAARETTSERTAWFPGHGWLSATHRDADDLRCGQSISGPAVVTQPTNTIVVAPGQELRATEHGGYLLALVGETA